VPTSGLGRPKPELVPSVIRNTSCEVVTTCSFFDRAPLTSLYLLFCCLDTAQVQVRTRVQTFSTPNEHFVAVLGRPLPFKIPVINMRHVNSYPEIFEWGEPEYKSSVDCWIDSFGGSATSETTVVANDMQWQKTLQVLCDLTLMVDDGDQQPRWVHSRPNFTGMHEKGVLVTKGGARLDVFDRATLIQRLAGKLHHSARLLLSRPCPEIVGVATGLEGGTIHRIYYENGAFHEELVESYQFLTEGGRVEFVRDIFKIRCGLRGRQVPLASSTSHPMCA
jgi:hypothetical protein